jgi:hypothetical protein
VTSERGVPLGLVQEADNTYLHLMKVQKTNRRQSQTERAARQYSATVISP